MPYKATDDPPSQHASSQHQCTLSRTGIVCVTFPACVANYDRFLSLRHAVTMPLDPRSHSFPHESVNRRRLSIEKVGNPSSPLLNQFTVTRCFAGRFIYGCDWAGWGMARSCTMCGRAARVHLISFLAFAEKEPHRPTSYQNFRY